MSGKKEYIAGNLTLNPRRQQLLMQCVPCQHCISECRNDELFIHLLGAIYLCLISIGLGLNSSSCTLGIKYALLNMKGTHSRICSRNKAAYI